MKPASNRLFSQGIKIIAGSIFYWISFICLLYLLSAQAGFLFPPKWNRFAYGIFGIFSAIICTYIFCRIEKKSFKGIALLWKAATPWRFIKGVIVGSLIFGLILLILLAFTPLQLVSNPEKGSGWDLFWYLSILPLAFMEELAFRSYAFLRLHKKLGLFITQIIVSIAFAFYHIVQGWDITIAFLGPAVWAWVFGLAAIWSGGIALPTGIHVALNIWQPITGIKTGDYYSVWLLNTPPGTPAALMATTEPVGIGIQLLVLAVAIIFTALYIRNFNSSDTSLMNRQYKKDG